MEALPDYEVILQMRDGMPMSLGARPNTSASQGLKWVLNEPVPVSRVLSVRLNEQDKMVSDAITEVQVTGGTVISKDYKFEFQMQRSFAIGLQAFFLTPIGMAIGVAFGLAVLLMILSSISV